MLTQTELTPAVVNEAAAILEAEWMRLMRHGAASVDGHLAEPAESVARHVCPPAPAVGVAWARRPVRAVGRGVSLRLASKQARRRVWPTQRSPPGERVRQRCDAWER